MLKVTVFIEGDVVSDTVYKIDSSLEDIISALKDANNTLDEALDLMNNNVIAKITDDDIWAGEGKRAGLCLCEICQNYHSQITENLKKEADLLESLYKGAEYYMSNGRIPKIME